ncbi:ATPase [Aliiruegeria sabulilitoris]|uniref:ATPase n=1 Tax=Aliiruegeria sabulilitoris TaxID=1510458 RepID=UPI0008338A0C|nr:ATPase [Aliiruegeria sabulilitoris]NDR58182.1 ATPase [Pseudoruegeria sp. M32A2M]
MTFLPRLYQSSADWAAARQKRILLFGMSGLGKTYVSDMLRAQGEWFHYSVDYRIGTRYMGELISDEFKREAMKVPHLRDLLMSDSIYIASNITFNNLKPLSTYLGKPGDPAKGGLSIDEYRKRQEQHHDAERAALLDAPRFIARAEELYGYPHFVCDSGGSICEVVDPDDSQDEILRSLAGSMLLVWIKGSEAHSDELVRRFEKAPKPMCYRAAFTDANWEEFLRENNVKEDEVDPNAFVRFAYRRAMASRQPAYAAMARNWGVTVTAEEVSEANSPQAFEALIGRAIDRV